MSNLPIGNDEFAPYNIKEATFKFDLEVRGTVWYEYYGNLDTEEAFDVIKSRLKVALAQAGDIEIKDIDVSIY